MLFAGRYFHNLGKINCWVSSGLLLWLLDVYLGRCELVFLISHPALSELSCSESKQFLFFSAYNCVHATACYFFNSRMGQCLHFFSYFDEVTVTVTALAFVVLRNFASAPGIEIALVVNRSSMIVTACNLHHPYLLKPRNTIGLVHVLGH